MIQMADEKKSSKKVKGVDELQKKVDEAEEKGYYGADSVIDNKEFSLQSGPDSPDAREQLRAAHATRDVE
jgi:hypothetical protein